MNFRNLQAVRAAGGVLLAALLMALPAARSSEWPRFLGPHQNGALPEETLPDSWPAAGPEKLWQIAVGSGFSGPIALAARVILHHRLGDEEQVWSLDPTTGKRQWRFTYPAAYRDDFGFDNGPRATPAAHQGCLYTLGALGKLHCLDLQSGRLLWNLDTHSRFQVPKGFFGIACSPLIEGGLLILNIGSPQHGGIIAFDRITGAVRWKTSRDPASYASPIVADIAGSRLALCFDREGFKAVDIRTGKIRSAYPWRPRLRASVNAASPLVDGNQVLLTASYGAGAVLLDLAEAEPKKLWSNDASISCHYATPVLHRSFLYGFHGRQEHGAILNCVSWNTGQVQWSQPEIRNGSIALIGNRLLILQENGELILAAADPQRFQELDRAQILPAGVRAHPAFANGILYARSPKYLAAFRLR